MIPTPRGWTRQEEPAGLVLTAPGGCERGVICYAERVRPLVSLDAVIEDVLARLDRGRLLEVRALITAEGEPAATIVAEGEHQGLAIRQHVGLVFGDDFYACVNGFAPASDDAVGPAVAAVTQGASLGLGVRRRPVQHTGPAGWRRHERGFRCEWTPPGCEVALITVFPAEPCADTTLELCDAVSGVEQARGFRPVRTEEIELVELPDGRAMALMAADGVDGRGRPSYLEHMLLADGRYAYVARLDSGDPERQAEHVVAFQEVCRSLQLMPAPARPAVKTLSGAVGHWVC